MAIDPQTVSAAAPSLADKVRFLTDPAAYGPESAKVELVETHMSYVFLVGARAYKLKKPVRYPFLDFSTLAARERDCREELRLNRRLAAEVYLDVVPLTANGTGFVIGGAGLVVDWLVAMRRLPQERMLDTMIGSKRVEAAHVDAICDALARFYRHAETTSLAPEDYAARFPREQALNREILTRAAFGLGAEPLRALDRLEARLDASRASLEARARAGRVVDGHGDLRPEHICLVEPVAIFDCLEFNAELRQVDPFDEIALLGVECARLGAPRLLRSFAEGLASRLGCAPPWETIALYAGWRAVLRARLSLAHLLEPSPRAPGKWAPLARLYLDIAARALAGAFPEGDESAVS
jgi:aminoglycoside phosphotransferase family enzyme